MYIHVCSIVYSYVCTALHSYVSNRINPVLKDICNQRHLDTQLPSKWRTCFPWDGCHADRALETQLGFDGFECTLQTSLESKPTLPQLYLQSCNEPCPDEVDGLQVNAEGQLHHLQSDWYRHQGPHRSYRAYHIGSWTHRPDPGHLSLRSDWSWDEAAGMSKNVVELLSWWMLECLDHLNCNVWYPGWVWPAAARKGCLLGC